MLFYRVVFGFIFEPFETAKPSWALPGCAEANTQAWFLTPLSMIPSISLLALLPFFVLDWIPVSPDSSVAQKLRRLLGFRFLPHSFPCCLRCMFLAGFLLQGLFLSPSPSPFTPLILAAMSRPLVPAPSAPPLYHSHLPWEALSALPSAAPLEVPFSALVGS